jgi:hypothetical protein
MAGRRNYRVPLTLMLATVLACGSGNAWAEDENPSPPRPTTVVYTTKDSAVIEASNESKAARTTVASRGGRRQCKLERDTANIGFGSSRIYAEHAAAGETSFMLYCDGELVGLVWRKINPAPRPAALTPIEIAERLRREIPLPAGSVRMNPDMGLVGTESWFWIEGYRGEPLTSSTDALGVPVTVEARPTTYHWSFGDGTTLETTAPGTAYPDRSEVRHVFEKSSSSMPGGYPVEVRFGFAVRYSTNGGAWVDLPPITRTASARYQVRESQAVLSR